MGYASPAAKLGGNSVERRRRVQCWHFGLDETKPEQTFVAKVFPKETVRSDRHELFNRPAIGLSMLVGSLHATMINVEEGAAAGTFNATLAKEFKTMLCTEHNIA